MAGHKGFARGAAMAVTLLLLAGCTSTPPADGGAGASIGDLPADLGGLMIQSVACETAFGDDAETLATCLSNAEQRAGVTDEVAGNASAAYDGADAKVADYADAKLSTFALGVVVAAESPGLWTQYQGAAGEQRSGIHQLEFTQTEGDVDCLLHSTMTVRIEAEVAPEDYAVLMCQRSANGVTAQIRVSGAQGRDVLPIETVVAWTNALYEGATS